MIFYLNLTIDFMLTIRSQELHTVALEIEEGALFLYVLTT